VIVSCLMGGLGNQMFQYSVARRLALKHGTKVKIDLAWLETEGKKADAIRVYELGAFKIEAGFYKPKLFSKPRLVHENQFKFDPTVLELPDNVLLQGYWQSYKYFEDQADQIRKDFTFKTVAEGVNAKILKEIKQTTAVSIHIRRGDYLTSKASSQFHGTQSLEYYRTAVGELTKKVKSPHFFVFSDEPAWCKQNLKFDFPTTYAENNSANSGHEDMRLMSACQHHILANSSFSWWGAWLNPNPSKLVIAPKLWFRDKSIDTSDLMPEGWIRL